MKVMRTLLTAALLLFFFQNHAQILRGVVRDAASGESLAGAQLSLRTAPGLPPAVTHSDSSGAYVFSALKPGYYLLEIEYDGYKPMIVWDVDIVAGKETVLDVAYNQLYSLPELSISARAEQGHRPMPLLGVAPLSGVQTERVPATFFDPARLAQAYPGVSGNDDQANGLIVRGNSPAALRWRLEGLDVVNPNHLPNAGTFADRPAAAAGGVLMFSAQLLDQSALLTGSQPTGYGDAIAGTMDIRLRPGNDQRHEFTAQAGLLGLDMAAEGPLTGRGKSSYLINYRYSTVGLLGQMGINFGDETITFQDLSVNLAAPRTRAGNFRLFAMWGNSSNYFEHKADSASIELNKDIFNIDYTSRTLITGASWYKKLSTRSWIRAAHIHSGQINERVAESGGIAYGEFQKDYSDETIASTALSLGHQLSPTLRLEEGASYIFRDYQYRIARDIRINSDDYQVETLQPWAQLSWSSTSGQTTVTGGLHSVWWLQNEVHLEPRLSIVQRLDDQQTISGSWGLHSQTPAWWQWDFKYDNELIRSSHAALRYAWRSVDNTWRFGLEVFDQRISDAVALPYLGGRISSLNESEAPFPNYFGKKSRSEGHNYGLEISAERRYNKGWFLLVNGTFFSSKTRLEGGEWSDSRWSLGQIAHLSGGKEWHKTVGENKTKTFGCSGRLSWSGGQRALPIDFAASQAADATVYDASQGFSEQLPDFFRLDARVYWRTSVGDRRNSTFAMDFQNLTLQQNIAYYFYDAWTQKIETKYQLGLVPNLSWRLEF